ncbi:MAG: gfo/Idh/MocA family oxidoreductase, partial [Planctomycetota bacterium]
MSVHDRKLRFGICGLGFMGRTYFTHLRDHSRARVAALCDRDPDRRAGRWNDAVGNLDAAAASPTSDGVFASCAEFDELLAREDVDVVAITLPTSQHADLTVRAFSAGKHVLCEKPMALTVADCDRMIAAARSARRTLMIAQCIRFWPQYEVIKREVDAGAIGAVRMASLRRIASPPTYSAGGWLMRAEQSGGAAFDLHVHDVDFAQHLLGIPESVSAIGRVGASGGVDHVHAHYRYADGRFALIEGGWERHAPWPFVMEITVNGEDGTLHWNMNDGRQVLKF